MQIYWNNRKRLQKKGVQLPQDWFGTPTWPPFHWFGTPICLPWRHVKTLYTKADNLLNTSKADLIRHLHISHNILCLPPKTFHNLCFLISPWYFRRPKRNWRQWLWKFWGASKTHYGSCTDGEYSKLQQNCTRWKEIQESFGFWIPSCGFRNPGTGFQYLSVEVGVRILIVSGIQDSKAQHSAFHEQKFPTFRIPQAKFSRIPICEVTATRTLFMITQITTCKSADNVWIPRRKKIHWFRF